MISPGNNGLAKETFWSELREIFIDSSSETKEQVHLSTSQRQAIIRLIEKKDKDRRFIQNWRPIKCRFKNNIKSSFREA